MLDPSSSPSANAFSPPFSGRRESAKKRLCHRFLCAGLCTGIPAGSTLAFSGGPFLESSVLPFSVPRFVRPAAQQLPVCADSAKFEVLSLRHRVLKLLRFFEISGTNPRRDTAAAAAKKSPVARHTFRGCPLRAGLPNGHNLPEEYTFWLWFVGPSCRTKQARGTHDRTVACCISIAVAIAAVFAILSFFSVRGARKEALNKVEAIELLRREGDAIRTAGEQQSRGLRLDVGNTLTQFQAATVSSVSALSGEIVKQVEALGERLESNNVTIKERIEGCASSGILRQRAC
jgi:hypothetical protein